jgi:hypothetical protein
VNRRLLLVIVTVLVVLASIVVVVRIAGGRGSTGALGSTSPADGRPASGTPIPNCQTRSQQVKDAKGNVFVRLDATSPDDVWAVGAHYLGGKAVPFSARWNGDSWQPVEVPDDNRLAELQDVVAISPGDAWAVGTWSDNRTMIYHWNSSRWKLVESPNLIGDLNELMGVDASSSGDVWAVGKGTIDTARRYRTLIEHLQGGSWHLVPSPNLGTDDNVLRDVVVVSASDVWAVGWRMGMGTHYRTLVEHWNGSSWQIIPSPNPGFDNYLSGVAAAGPKDIWAVGWSGDGPDRSKALTMHWNGTRWQIAGVPETSTTETRLEDVTIGNAGIFAVGQTADDASTFRTLVLRFDRSGWIRIPSENGGSEHSFLSGAVVTGDQLFAGGTHVSDTGGYSAHVEHGCS